MIKNKKEPTIFNLRIRITVFLLIVCLANSGFAAQQPNIIMILADDLGIGNVGCYGADNFKTPHIDALAQEGIRFTRAYVTPLCGPTRALLQTGRYAFRTGAVNQDRVRLIDPAKETFIPAILKSEGYVTSAVGKWGQLPLKPSEFGFDDYLQCKGSGVYWNTQETGKSYEVNGETRLLEDKQYMPDLMHRHVTKFIERNRNQPFFIYYSLSHVHAEILPTPDSLPDSQNLFADNVTYMDKLVGMLVKELERQRLREKTLLIFVGDNGVAGPYSDRSTVGGRRLAGQKGSMLDGGALVPMIASWPGVTPSGRVSENLIDGSDLFPTFAELCGAEVPKNIVLDGRSFAPQLHGKAGAPRNWIFVQLARMWYVRDAGWKLNQAGELFDMSGAPFEEKLVAANSSEPEASAARARLQAALDSLNPAGGILDDGDGTGRHARNKKKKPIASADLNN